MGHLSIDQWSNLAASMLVTVVCAVFVVTYHLRATWWRSEMGRNVMALAVAVGALFAYTVLVSLWPDGCLAMVLRWVRTGIALTIAVVMAQRTRVLVRIQRQHHDHTGV
ncbi:hypothetical protein ACH4F6_38990 [Streptomyces sp. NPDC017936]|uniref:putative phage holin n=1 Tax=Streptomyces sp. NPDC017936 TaxID=3365016 RepID=UPI0037BC4ACB